jgi:precorrin-6A/cobalt-precorrin-6A reductase
MKILILGGTADARELAERLTALGHDVTTSLAGRTRQPAIPAGQLRVGKFGGIPGLVGYLQAAGIERLVDATHPYAGLISVNAVGAAQTSGIPLVRYMRPAWVEPEGAGWMHVPSVAAAAEALPPNAHGFITTGHEGLERFVERDDCRLMARLIEPPTIEMGRVEWLQEIPPYSLEGERALFETHGFTHLVTKNSGGEATRAKLDVARERGVQVIMVARPAYGPAREVGTIEEAVRAVVGP